MTARPRSVRPAIPLFTAEEGRCPSPACVTVEATRPSGTTGLVAQGFLHGITKSTDKSLLDGLRARHWRLSDETTYDLAKAQGARVTWMISDSWWRETCKQGTPACPVPPWNDWPRYEEFVRSVVRRSIATNRPVDYWDIVNEPGTPETGSGTVDQYLEQFRRAHNAIRSIDPDARIVGPSIPAFADEPYPVDGHRSRVRDLDLQTFLDYVMATALQFDALSWHEHSSDPPESNPARLPEDVVDHVRRARALIADRPTVGSMEIHVNEYVTAKTRRIPGWNLGWISALERADVSAAMRGCFIEKDPGEPAYGGCGKGALDGILLSDGRTPRPTYWVHRLYASMTGSRVRSDSNSGMSSFAVRNDAERSIAVLVGRHELCTPETNPDCGETRRTPPADMDVAIRSPYGAGEWRVTVRRIPNKTGSLMEPEPMGAAMVAVAGDWLTIRLPQVRDGDVYAVDVDRG